MERSTIICILFDSLFAEQLTILHCSEVDSPLFSTRWGVFDKFDTLNFYSEKSNPKQNVLHIDRHYPGLLVTKNGIIKTKFQYMYWTHMVS
jgi:hypothetical protein